MLIPANALSSIVLAAGVCLLLLADLGAQSAAGAAVYKCPSPEGAVTYSDTPCPGGEQMDISLPPPAAPAPGEEAQSPESRAKTAPDTAAPFSGYSAIAILSPGSEQVARDSSGAGDIPVALAITPALRLDLGHAIRAYVDGGPWPGRFSTPQFALSGLDAGTHSLRAVITDASGRQLATSGTISFTLLRTTAESTDGGEAPPDLPYPRPGGDLPYPRPGGDLPYPRPMPRPSPR
ncbi:MAG TPA: DUF4124 domain-containing protein [Burkholderiales bacterium]|nr:DUF4124 domain-containing protein [Burkholderiales bacterium]